jgi:coenzyme PQQ precursor peptide PqqA
MRWITPDFEEINLSGEVTAYANTDEAVRAAESRPTPVEPPAAAEQVAAATK